VPQQPLDAGVIRDTVRAVFRAREFQPRASIWWWTKYLPSLSGHENLARLVAYLVAALAVLLLVSTLTRRALRARRFASAASFAHADAEADHWSIAGSLARRGAYAEAAHALFAALLQALARRGSVVPHPSKTLREYTRELREDDVRRRGAVRSFLLLYEGAVFGLSGCDEACFARLQALARAATDSNG
jgi:Domain of unknown function (DUF4129)